VNGRVYKLAAEMNRLRSSSQRALTAIAVMPPMKQKKAVIADLIRNP
jgi:hypothetical protein